MVTGVGGRILSIWHKWGAMLRMLWGEGMLSPFEAVGCQTMNGDVTACWVYCNEGLVVLDSSGPMRQPG